MHVLEGGHAPGVPLFPMPVGGFPRQNSLVLTTPAALPMYMELKAFCSDRL